MISQIRNILRYGAMAVVAAAFGFPAVAAHAQSLSPRRTFRRCGLFAASRGEHSTALF